MSNIILDVGSGNTLKNDLGVVRELVNAVADQNTGKHEVTLKAQLFEYCPPNEMLYWDVFTYLWEYANGLGYPVTASVFDRNNLNALLDLGPPFVKVSCNREYWWLVEEVPRKYRVHVSVPYEGAWTGWHDHGIYVFCCIPKYPATLADYEAHFDLWGSLDYCISDHTVGLDLYEKYKPEYLEKHVCLKREKDNPDAGPFAMTVKELGQLL
jgi:sialic acid synthase SpsE